MFTIAGFLTIWEWYFCIYNTFSDLFGKTSLCVFPHPTPLVGKDIFTPQSHLPTSSSCVPVIINETWESSENIAFIIIVGHLWWPWLGNMHTISILGTPSVQSMMILGVNHLTKATNHRTLQISTRVIIRALVSTTSFHSTDWSEFVMSGGQGLECLRWRPHNSDSLLTSV